MLPLTVAFSSNWDLRVASQLGQQLGLRLRPANLLRKSRVVALTNEHIVCPINQNLKEKQTFKYEKI